MKTVAAHAHSTRARGTFLLRFARRLSLCRGLRCFAQVVGARAPGQGLGGLACMHRRFAGGGAAPPGRVGAQAPGQRSGSPAGLRRFGVGAPPLLRQSSAMPPCRLARSSVPPVSCTAACRLGRRWRLRLHITGRPRADGLRPRLAFNVRRHEIHLRFVSVFANMMHGV